MSLERQIPLPGKLIFGRLLESRGLRFCRYADDCLIFVRTPRAGERVRESVTRYLESVLKLKVNQEKTVVGGADTVKFLGFKLFRNKAVHVNIHPSSLESFRKAVREKTKRNRNRSLVSILDEMKTYVRGWFGYFSIGLSKSRREELNGWMRRRIRQYIFKQWKTPRNRARQLIKLCPEFLKPHPEYIPDEWRSSCHKVAYNRSYWTVSGYSVVRYGLSNKVLKDLGMYFIPENVEKWF